MRNPEPQNKKIYIRFHKELDAKIETFSKKTGMKRATAIAFILRKFLSEIKAKIPDLSLCNRKNLGFSPIGEAYYIPIGRSDEGHTAGKRTIITITKENDRDINYIALKFGYTPSRLRTEILVKYFCENGIL